MPVAVLLNGWGTAGLGLLLLAVAIGWMWLVGNGGLAPPDPNQALAVGGLVVIDAAIILGRAGALLARFGGRRRAPALPAADQHRS